MRLVAEPSLTPPTSSDLDAFENYYLDGRKLPESFRHFLHHFNGAIPLTGDNAISSAAVADDIVIERFLPSLENVREHPDSWAAIGVVLTQISDRATYDPDADLLHLIPFAALFAGDFLVLDYRFDPPAVSLWDHERSVPDAPHATVIAETFDDFLALIDVRLP